MWGLCQAQSPSSRSWNNCYAVDAMDTDTSECVRDCSRTYAPSRSQDRVRVSGKFFRAGGQKWFPKGLCYGPFRANRYGESLPEPERVNADFAHMHDLGANCVRLYFPPPTWFLEKATEHGFRELGDVPWERHGGFFEVWSSKE